MGLEAATIATISAVATVAGTAYNISQNMKSREAQQKAKLEQEAMNKQNAMEERRRQVREERIKQARILQASSNTGVAESSGEIGSSGAMATMLSSNIGANSSKLNLASNISGYQQEAADARSSGATVQQAASLFGQGVEFAGSSIFKDPDPLGTFIVKNKLG